MTRTHAVSPIPSRVLDARGRAPMVRRILFVYRSADVDAFVAGATWYVHANDLARTLADETAGRVSARHVAGVIAALSPQNNWEKNVKDASRAILHRSARGLHTHCQTDKADAILSGADPLDVLNGPKERAFFSNIADPSDPAPVTIDRHAHDIAAGRPFGDGDRGLSSVGRYANLAASYRRAGDILGEAPNVVQAVTWQVWTGRTTLAELPTDDGAWSAAEDARARESVR